MRHTSDMQFVSLVDFSVAGRGNVVIETLVFPFFTVEFVTPKADLIVPGRIDPNLRCAPLRFL